jgi:LysR family transcriptional regulator, cell division regulator
MLPSPADLTYFIEVAATSNISRAAERLGISQPSLSQAIKRLEESFGTALLIRSKTGVQLTKVGDRFVREAKQLVERWETLRQDARKASQGLTGIYTLGCHSSVALYTVPKLFTRLMNEHPSLEFQLTHGLSRQITDGVIGFKIDFGIVINPVSHPDLVIKQLATDQVTLYVANQPSTKNFEVLSYDPELLRQLKRQERTFRRTITTTSLEVAAALASEGVGVAILPGKVAERFPELRPLPGKHPRFSDVLCFIYRADAEMQAQAKAVFQAAQTAFQG